MIIKKIESIMGSGKTTAIFKMMHHNQLVDKYIYVSPLRSEIGSHTDDDGTVHPKGRIQKALPDMNFFSPRPFGTSLIDDFRNLILGGNNIATTHATFNNLTQDDLDLIRESDYTLIIDESLNVIEDLVISEKMLTDMIHNGNIIREGNQLSWNHTDHPIIEQGYELRDLAIRLDLGSAFIVRKKACVSEFPFKLLAQFNEIYILSYKFDGSYMQSWLDTYGVETINATHELFKFGLRSEDALKVLLKPLLNIYEPQKDAKMALSQGWYKTAKLPQIKKLKLAITQFVTHAQRSRKKAGDSLSTRDLLITMPKKSWESKKFSGNKYRTATWIPSNLRATNKYADKKAIIYALNKHPHVIHRAHIEDNSDIKMDADAYALAEMLQAIWRGCIRNGEPMDLYIVHPRMRTLLKDWLDS